MEEEEKEELIKHSKKSHIEIGPSHIRDAAYHALYGGGKKSVVNALGQAIWEDDQKGRWPQYLYKRKALPPSLSSLL